MSGDRIRLLSGALLLVVLASSCAEDRPTQPAAPVPPTADHELPPEIPDEARNLANPVAASASSIESGGRTFSTMCTPCHGPNGDGTGHLAQHLHVEPANFTEPELQDSRTDGELFYVLTYGHGAMPGQMDRLEDELKWDLINYVRTLRRDDSPQSDPAERSELGTPSH